MEGPDGLEHVTVTHGPDEVFATDPVLLADGTVDVDASPERLERDLRRHDSVLVRLLLSTRGGKDLRRAQVELARRGWEEINRGGLGPA